MVTILLNASGPMSWEELEYRASEAYRDDEYGQAWRERLLMLTGKHERTVRRWKDGDTKIPGPVAAMVRAHHMCRLNDVEF